MKKLSRLRAGYDLSLRATLHSAQHRRDVSDHLRMQGEPFLRVSQSKLPESPDALADPKQKVVDLARGSSSRDVRTDLVPTSGGGRRVGPAYVSRMIEFVESIWVPGDAVARSDSLRRCIACLASMSSA